MPVLLKKFKKIVPASITLPSSKSESNRALVINALAGSGFQIQNLSEARDTEIMLRLLSSGDKVLDVLDAGTTMRFLTSFFSTRNMNKVLTGSRRMRERPIGLLVDALRSLGANIDYLEKQGFPPIETISFSEQKAERISIRGDISSQFISAILMVAPALPMGLVVELTGKIGSRPYIDMTLGIMAHFGINYQSQGNLITIKNQPYLARPFTVSPDWSGASYWYSLVALAEEAEIRLPGLSESSYQGDRVISRIMHSLGVTSKTGDGGITLSKRDHEKEMSWDFTDCPDLVQTVVVTAAAKGVILHLRGIESLRIKETDRIAALQKELAKTGAVLKETGNGEFILHPCERNKLPGYIEFETYDDHRMAMAFAPFAALTDTTILGPDSVKKSYPGFWNDLEKAGIRLIYS
ncbi:MAG TPA: hypothetical protein VI583_08485 [Cyclobacteriaceae bacterium]|nr:hypothetical protein [Cyclobacteriaceae bacterium]